MYSKNYNPNFNSKHNSNHQMNNISNKINYQNSQEYYNNKNRENKENFVGFNKINKEIKHSNVPENFKINYIEFEELENFKKGIDPEKIFELIKEDFLSKDWIKQFRAINSIRRIHKYYPKEINLIFAAFGDFIKESLISTRTCILRNTTAFINEIVENSQKSNIEISILIKLPKFVVNLKKHTSPDIKKMAEITLSNFTQKCCCVEMLHTFLDLSVKKKKDKIDLIHEEVFFYLTEIIGFLGQDIAKLKTETLTKIFIVLALNLTKSKLPENRNLAKRIFCYLQNLMGQINFMKFLEMLLKDQVLDFSICREISECGTKKKQSKRISIKEDLDKMNYNRKTRDDLNIEIYF